MRVSYGSPGFSCPPSGCTLGADRLILWTGARGLSVIQLKDFVRSRHHATKEAKELEPVEETLGTGCVKLITSSDGCPLIAAGDSSGCVRIWDGETLELR
jgi:hypothetical protein